MSLARPRMEFWFQCQGSDVYSRCLPTLWLWEDHLLFQHLSFFNCKMETIIVLFSWGEFTKRNPIKVSSRALSQCNWSVWTLYSYFNPLSPPFLPSFPFFLFCSFLKHMRQGVKRWIRHDFWSWGIYGISKGKYACGQTGPWIIKNVVSFRVVALWWWREKMSQAGVNG